MGVDTLLAADEEELALGRLHQTRHVADNRVQARFRHLRRGELELLRRSLERRRAECEAGVSQFHDTRLTHRIERGAHAGQLRVGQLFHREGEVLSHAACLG